tara:strand:- start:47 stop:430 length:384 start_codon:yes stop_codon:yes gene_type:complete
MPKITPPSAEEILDGTIIPEELQHLETFEDIWSEWVCYKQEECADRDGYLKPWNSVKAGQRALSMIRNQFMKGRDVVHVINESMNRQWIGIRFDIIEDKPSTFVRSKDQVSALDLEWSKLQKNRIEQ